MTDITQESPTSRAKLCLLVHTQSNKLPESTSKHLLFTFNFLEYQLYATWVSIANNLLSSTYSYEMQKIPSRRIIFSIKRMSFIPRQYGLSWRRRLKLGRNFKGGMYIERDLSLGCLYKTFGIMHWGGVFFAEIFLNLHRKLFHKKKPVKSYNFL